MKRVSAKHTQRRKGTSMRHVLLADSLKSSLVMTSEIFKDHIRECAIHIVGNGKECVEFLENRTPDMVVVDFDLPDTDGVMLSKLLRKSYKGPIIITAYPHRIVDEAIQKELFAYNDSCHWIKKPVRMEDFSEVIDQFLLGKRRVHKRFPAEFKAYVVGRSGGRGKRTPKLFGKTVDISMGGVKVKSKEVIVLKEKEPLTVTLSVLGSDESEPHLLKVKGHLAWKSKDGFEAGVCFNKLSESQRNFIEEVIKDQTPVEEQVQCLQVCQAS